jgi:hypothetical protein
MHQYRPASMLNRHPLDPPFSRQLDQGDGLEGGIWVIAEERHVRCCAGSSSGATHPLEE